MKEKSTDKVNFMNNLVAISQISKHYHGCNYENKGWTMHKCLCDCYIKQIFLLGMQAQKDLFYS